MTNIWFVIHHRDLWDIDNRRIGFHQKHHWELLQRGDIVIYCQAGEMQIKGVFRIIKKQIEKWNSHPRFTADGKYKDLDYQCKLELLCDNIICLEPKDEKRFSFLPEFGKSLHGYHKQVFSANREDLKLILADPTIARFPKTIPNADHTRVFARSQPLQL
jgi:hypothetical protein